MINNNHEAIKVPGGYKQTEVGVIPEDWEVLTLHEMAISNGLVRGPFGGALKKEIFKNRGFKVYEQRNAIYSTVELGSYFVDAEKFTQLNRFSIVPGDFIISCSGTIGRIFQLPEDAPKGIINQALLKVTLRKDINHTYFLKYFKWEKFQERIIDGTQGGAMKNLVGMDEFRNSVMAFPKLKKEQTAIANALSDVDALIAELEKLITKKEAIKTGAMQQLLTGRTRLPQFAKREDGTLKGYKQSELGEIPEDWEVVEIGSLLKIRHGKSQKQVEIQNGLYPILGTGGVIGTTNHYLCNKPSVLIGRKGTINKPVYIDKPFWTVDTLFYSEVEDIADARFVFYKFCMINWMEYNEASGVPSLNSKTIERVNISTPKTKEEQVAISKILSDMDSEIEVLEKRLEKTKAIKQGMMQELLTGRTRLV